jgi:hypothetical protein
MDVPPSVGELVCLDEVLDIFMIDQHLATDLNEGEMTRPDLAAPVPGRYPEKGHQLFDRVEPFRGHSLGTPIFKHLDLPPFLSFQRIDNPLVFELRLRS